MIPHIYLKFKHKLPLTLCQYSCEGSGTDRCPRLNHNLCSFWVQLKNFAFYCDFSFPHNSFQDLWSPRFYGRSSHLMTLKKNWKKILFFVGLRGDCVKKIVLWTIFSTQRERTCERSGTDRCRTPGTFEPRDDIKKNWIFSSFFWWVIGGSNPGHPD